MRRKRTRRALSFLNWKSEEATRQQGGLFFRENSSNGGKAIRTFWRNTKFGKIKCQGQNMVAISRYLGISYGGDQTVQQALTNSPFIRPNRAD